METKKYDYYSGFEGEAESVIRFRNKQGELKRQMRIWAGYWDRIMNAIPPNEKGEWEGLALDYHLAEAWEEEEICNYEQLAIRQLKAISFSDQEELENEIREQLLRFFEQALEKGKTISIAIE